MAYDEALAQRIREALDGDPALTEKKMFGGLAFMHRGLMFVGVSGTRLMARVGAAQYADSLAREHVREMDFTGRPMNGYVYVEPAGLTDDGLQFWVQRCKAFVMTLPAKAARPATAAKTAKSAKGETAAKAEKGEKSVKLTNSAKPAAKGTKPATPPAAAKKRRPA
ncbi:MAG: TfoX/Sxy family protein [Burkholderiaceae bacterium]